MIGCLFGHYTDNATFSGGVFFGECDRCGRDLIRARGGRWHRIPKKYVIAMNETGHHAVSPRTLLKKSRKHAPLLHRLRPQRRDPYQGYFD